MVRPDVVRPGVFGVQAAADTRRGIFDMHNEAILASGLPVDTVFMGDSITEMWALDTFFQRTDGRLLVNRGIGGDRTPYGRRRFEADVLQLRPRLVVQKLGVNNIWDLDIWWDASQRREPADVEDEIVADNAAMVADARAHGIAMALCSILPTNIPFNGNTAIRNAIIARANRRLQDAAAHHGAVFVDYHSHLVGEDGLTLRDGLADDGLHPHVLGYRIMAQVLVDTLAAAGIDALKLRQMG